MADPTITGGASVNVSDLPAASQQAVANAFATINSLGTVTSSSVNSSLTTPPADSASTETVYTVSGDDFTTTPAVVPTAAGPVAIIFSGTSNATVVGNASATAQVIVGNAGNDVIDTAGGSGTVIAGDGNNTIGIPTTSGGGSTPSSVDITVGNGNNSIFAGSGNNMIVTGTGNNTVGLGSGNNLVYAQGNDTLIAGSGNQTIGAGAGNVDIFAGTGQSTLIGGSGNDQIFIGSGSGNVAVAGTGNTTIVGGTGNNTFIGGNASTANSLIYGGTGNETIFGGAGHETMYGGGGNNLFAFTSGSSLGGGNNVIGDFNVKTDHLGFLGYGSAAQILANSTVVGGSTVISLTDGTKITLVGVTNLTAGSLVTS